VGVREGRNTLGQGKQEQREDVKRSFHWFFILA
jgi:hypothetical protein